MKKWLRLDNQARFSLPASIGGIPRSGKSSLWNPSGLAEKLAFLFDGSNDYIASRGNIWWPVVRSTDWVWKYMACYNWGFDMGNISIDNRSVQTMKWRWTFDSFWATNPLCGYWNWSTSTLNTLYVDSWWVVKLELQWTGSWRRTCNTPIVAWTEYNIIVRINNALTSWSARVVWDADVFVNWVKQTLSFTSTWTVTTTVTQLYRWCYTTALCHIGKMRTLNIRNTALSDSECIAETGSVTVIQTTGLINSYNSDDIAPSIWRTGYDMNVGGNIYTGTDWNWDYINFNGNYRRDLATWSIANISSSASPSLTQAVNFTIKVKFQVTAFSADNNTSGIFWSSNLITIYLWNNVGLLTFRLRNGGTFTDVTQNISINTLYEGYLVYNQVQNKMYAYLSTWWAASVLLNSWGTTVAAATFWGTQAFLLWDNAVWGWNYTSCSKAIYNAWIAFWRAMTQAEIDADIALGNGPRTDPRRLAYYVPENLQYNTDHITTKDFTNASWVKTGTTPTWWQADLRWGTDACLLTMSAWAWNWVALTNNTITGSSLASKTFKFKVFAWTLTWTATMRLKISHNGVGSPFYSSDFTVTTTPQEFTFTQANTSWAGGTWMTYALEVWSGWLASTLVAYYPTDRITDQTLRDESPNTGWYIGRKTNKVFSCFYKPWADFADAPDAWALMVCPWSYMHDRSSTHQVQIRYDNRIAARVSIGTLGSSFRSKVHVIGCIYLESWVFKTKFYVNWVLVDSDVWTADAPITNYNTVAWSWRKWSTYYTWFIRDERIYIWTITDADGLTISQWWEPASATKYLDWKPKKRGWLSVTDRSGNSRTGTKTWGVATVKQPRA